MPQGLFTTYFKLRWRMIRNSISTQSWKRWSEISVSLVILLSVEWGGFILFSKAFAFLIGQGEIGQIMLDRLFNMGWTVIFLLLIISNIITAFSTLYRSPEVAFLLTTNLSYSNIFKLKYVDNVVFSSWAIVLLGLPLILAYGSIRGISGLTLLTMSTIGLLPLILIAGAIALIVTVLLARLSEYIKLRTSFVLLGIAFTGLFLLYRQFSQAEMVVAGDVSNLRYLGRYIGNLSRIPFPIAPSYWFSELFRTIINGDAVGLAFYSGLLLTTMLVAWEIMLLVIRRIYYPSWQILQSSSRIITTTNKARGNLFRARKWGKPRSQALYLKDLAQFLRTPQQWIQFLMFLLLIMIYIVNLSRIQYNLQLAGEFWQRLVYILNFGFSGFILASLITRFVFPLISIEGRNRWVLLSAPVAVGQILRQKFWLSVTIFFVLAELVAVISGLLLHQAAGLIIISSGMLLLMSVSLTSLSLGLGAVFPIYHETNPMRIVSGLGGIIAILLSLAYLGLMVLSMVGILGFYLSNNYNILFWGLVAGIVLANAVINYIPLRWGYRAMLRSFY
ncbi:MAG: hypothetical protein HQ562_01860 [Candidatus Marinimicrobia bacterium]|nr:hypothetical protein [Candidatus Neomarinimicrobiota bacterium]